MKNREIHMSLTERERAFQYLLNLALFLHPPSFTRSSNMYCLCKVSGVVKTRINKIFLLVRDLPSLLLWRLTNLRKERQSACAPTLSGRDEQCENGGDRDGRHVEGGDSTRLAIWHYLGWNKRPLI